MSFKENFSETLEVIRDVLSNKKYLALTLVVSFLAFIALYYLMVVQVADKSILISVMMSGPGYVTESIISILLISAGFGIYSSMLTYKYLLFNSIYGKGLFGFLGSGIGAFGVGCPTCGAFLFGLIGAPLALTYLPFKGIELRIASIFIIALSIHFTSKSIKRNVCNITSVKGGKK